uniref:(northern house mosquito) hypothetical protein n=1 Tax=Culex pipiens TaxID=7175 RepID=A0A8D8FTT2_CULPI
MFTTNGFEVRSSKICVNRNGDRRLGTPTGDGATTTASLLRGGTRFLLFRTFHLSVLFSTSSLMNESIASTFVLLRCWPNRIASAKGRSATGGWRTVSSAIVCFKSST